MNQTLTAAPLSLKGIRGEKRKDHEQDEGQEVCSDMKQKSGERDYLRVVRFVRK